MTALWPRPQLSLSSDLLAVSPFIGDVAALHQRAPGACTTDQQTGRAFAIPSGCRFTQATTAPSDSRSYVPSPISGSRQRPFHEYGAGEHCAGSVWPFAQVSVCRLTVATCTRMRPRRCGVRLRQSPFQPGFSELISPTPCMTTCLRLLPRLGLHLDFRYTANTDNPKTVLSHAGNQYRRRPHRRIWNWPNIPDLGG